MISIAEKSLYVLLRMTKDKHESSPLMSIFPFTKNTPDQRPS